MNHKTISFIKSGLRLAGYGVIVIATGSPVIFGVFLTLAIAEVLGFIEEIVPAKVK